MQLCLCRRRWFKSLDLGHGKERVLVLPKGSVVQSNTMHSWDASWNLICRASGLPRTLQKSGTSQRHNAVSYARDTWGTRGYF